MARTIKRTDGATVTVSEEKKISGNPTPFRIGAIACWVAAIAFEVLAVLVFVGKVDLGFCSTMVQLIGFLVLDLICVIVGSQLWKRSNHMSPISGKNKVLFWLYNNLGLVVCAFAFVPFIVIALTDKKADKKTKTVAAVVACIALLIGGLFSVDWNPVSKEEQDGQIAALDGSEVYWTQFGRVYHSHEDCGHLNHSDTLNAGTAEEAVAAGKGRLCKTCAAKDNIVIDENAEKQGEVSEQPQSEEPAESADPERDNPLLN